MLRVSVTTVGDVAEFRIEGCIASHAARELWAECRQQAREGRRLRLDLAGVTLVDDASLRELKHLIRRGSEVVNASLLVSALLDDEA